MYGAFNGGTRQRSRRPTSSTTASDRRVFSSLAARSVVRQRRDQRRRPSPSAFRRRSPPPTSSRRSASSRTWAARSGLTRSRAITTSSSSRMALWQQRFGETPGIVGTSVTIDGRPHTIVGVLPPLLDRTINVQVWRPVPFGTGETSVRRFHFLRGLGRLAPGVTVAQAQREMDGIARQLEQTYRRTKRGGSGWCRTARSSSATSAPIAHRAHGRGWARAAHRLRQRRESAARARDGAQRRDGDSHGTRGVTSATRQAAAHREPRARPGSRHRGLVLAYYSCRAFAPSVRASCRGSPSWRSTGRRCSFTFALSLATSLVFGLAPALHAAKGGVAAAMTSLGRGSGGRTGSRTRNVLVVAQVALSFVMLIVAGLLIRSLWQTSARGPGFDPHGVFTAVIACRGPSTKVRADVDRFWSALTDRVRAIPGVETAAGTTLLPLRGGGDTYFYVEGRPPATDADKLNATVSSVTDDYFQTMRIPVRSGRAFTGPIAPTVPA